MYQQRPRVQMHGGPTASRAVDPELVPLRQCVSFGYCGQPQCMAGSAPRTAYGALRCIQTPRHDITDSWVRVSWRLRGDGTCQSNLLRDILQPDACLGYAHHDLAGQVPAARKQDPIGFLLACEQVPVEAEPDPLGPVFLQTTARESRHDGRGRMRTHSFSEPVLGCSVPSPTGSVTVATQCRAASSASHASAQCECMPTGEARNLSRTFVQASIRGVD